MIRVVLCTVLLLAFGCAPPAPPETLFRFGRSMGVNQNPDLEEVSGLVASVRYRGKFWAHNDSGNPAALFLLDSAGKTVTSFRVAGARNRDWEDIAIGGPDSAAVLFIGDIGDNQEHRQVKYIYCVKEPTDLTSDELSVVDTLMIQFEGRPRDSEALLADPVSGNLYLVTKREREVRLYEIPYPFVSDTLILESVAQLPIQHITAGDISRDGSEILLRNYTSIFYWRRAPGQSVPEALHQPPVELPYEREPQGETIAWAVDGSGFYTLSENGKGERGRLLFYSRVSGD